MTEAQLEPSVASLRGGGWNFTMPGAAEPFKSFPSTRWIEVITWTSMINACGKCQPPRGRAAQQVFRKMLESGVKPNKVTLQALGRAIGFQKQRALLRDLGIRSDGP
ncbi:Hypothetical protein (Fragment) [Durusdinium trenchii]|uniref:Pentatricopeptide repeat-containing protein n=1 Tax=Durusdinium trenchii TaxID=1381693 RepID=A0ABP0PUT4_9DINO